MFKKGRINFNFNRAGLISVGIVIVLWIFSIFALIKPISHESTSSNVENVHSQHQESDNAFEYFRHGSSGEKTNKAKAAFVVLVRNQELEGWLSSMKELEDRFNKKYNYPYVFLNDKEFTEKFKNDVRSHTSAKVEFGLIPNEHWSVPESIDMVKAKKMWAEADYYYKDSLSYRHMCRYESGFFFRHHLLEKYDYYWRVEPDVHFVCDINFDPFRYLRDHNLKYGFTITWHEFMGTIPTLWETVNEYIDKKGLKDKLPKNNAARFLREKEGDDYNGCHFWTNFEIASLDLWRDQKYIDFFEHLDKKGGFFYERWGDAPVHSIYASLFLDKHEIHFFDEIGYKHNHETHCPNGPQYFSNNCNCDQKESFDFDPRSCTKEWKSVFE